MARTSTGDMVTDVYQSITQDLVSEYRKRATAITMKTLDPTDLDKSAPKYLKSMQLMGGNLSKQYLNISKNYINVFSAAEGVILDNTYSKDRFDRPFNDTKFTKRMMGSGIYSMKHKLHVVGMPMSSVSPTDKMFQSTVSNVANDFTKQVMESGRDTVVETSCNSSSFVGYGRATEGNACDFCQMLATRNDFISEESAGFEAHRACACVPEPATSDWAPSPSALEGYDRFLETERGKEAASENDDLYKSSMVTDKALDKPDGAEKITQKEAMSEMLG